MFCYNCLSRLNFGFIAIFLVAGDPDQHIITITGYEENVHRAKEDILKIVSELNDMVKEEVSIDSRVHSRLIGSRGRNIKKIMDEFKVDIKFPRNEDSDPNLVTITGNEENVAEAKDHLLNLEEEYVSKTELICFYLICLCEITVYEGLYRCLESNETPRNTGLLFLKY